MDRIQDFEGLFWISPLQATFLSLAFFSLAGIPLTAGFVAKFYLISAGISASLWGLVFVLVLASLLGLFYYLRVIGVIFRISKESSKIRARVSPETAVLGALSLFSVWLGIYPAPVLSWIMSQVNH